MRSEAPPAEKAQFTLECNWTSTQRWHRPTRHLRMLDSEPPMSAVQAEELFDAQRQVHRRAAEDAWLEKQCQQIRVFDCLKEFWEILIEAAKREKGSVRVMRDVIARRLKMRTVDLPRDPVPHSPVLPVTSGVLIAFMHYMRLPEAPKKGSNEKKEETSKEGSKEKKEEAPNEGSNVKMATCPGQQYGLGFTHSTTRATLTFSWDTSGAWKASNLRARL